VKTSVGDLTVRPIGWVHSPLTRPVDAPKQGYEGAPNARLEIEPSFRSGLAGMSAGEDILILTWLHLAQRDVLAVHPRDDRTRPLSGVFATRSADRPNPIGVHRVKLLAIEEDGWLLVEGLEAVSGTPIIDIKPALPKAGGW
jgi:tRNA-Thr(GGU) m(6)t(6)A37 methyltransferase TsaA